MRPQKRPPVHGLAPESRPVATFDDPQTLGGVCGARPPSGKQGAGMSGQEVGGASCAPYSRSPAASRANEVRPHLELLVEPHGETIRQTGECAPMPLEPLLCHPHDEKLWRAMGPAREPERTMATRSVRVAEMLRAAQHQIQLERSPSLASWLPRVDLSGGRDAEKRGASEVMQADDALFQTGADHPVARRLRARADREERASNEGCRSPRPPRHGPSSVSLAACPRNTPRGQTGDTCLLRRCPRSISLLPQPGGFEIWLRPGSRFPLRRGP